MFLFLIPVIILAGATAIGIGAEISASPSPEPAPAENRYTPITPSTKPLAPASAGSVREPAPAAPGKAR